MAGTLKRSDQGLKATIINMLRAVMENVKGVQAQMWAIRRQTDISRENQKEMLNSCGFPTPATVKTHQKLNNFAITFQ